MGDGVDDRHKGFRAGAAVTCGFGRVVIGTESTDFRIWSVREFAFLTEGARLVGVDAAVLAKLAREALEVVLGSVFSCGARRTVAEPGAAVKAILT